ncbi:hypothetical protein K505DRAFT_404094 [Melanomma pulvis-pyrius CBS 109.77]|uniref:Uncharacterized protein n=1 Tax=Melanomma pulvis-pyrius CBS 109.77 TaxID=1314802 RepID=A0A6A6XV36_9PLEO|nr:hypothetical protein K505DRAFT_404094 [Melanomma pulvis-pyrius CBS 109.77]
MRSSRRPSEWLNNPRPCAHTSLCHLLWAMAVIDVLFRPARDWKCRNKYTSAPKQQSLDLIVSPSHIARDSPQRLAYSSLCLIFFLNSDRYRPIPNRFPITSFFTFETLCLTTPPPRT